jgi:hypothetical protein
MESGCHPAIVPLLFPLLTIKLRLPKSGLRVCTTKFLSPTFVVFKTIIRVAVTIDKQK